jgi:glycosyltransferase involved in cell wall biosynthesis
VAVQIYTFFFAFRYIFTKNTFYVNTLLPIGPALAGRLMGKKVVYHYHENAFVKSTAYRMLARAMKMLASKIICVSEYQRTMLKKEKNVLVIPNALDERFLQGVHPDADRTYGYKTILMLATLKLYKGIREFIALAERLPEYRFRLVLNNSENEINQFINNEKLKITDNMTLMARVEDVAPLYNEASIVLNLTNKNYVIETFGLTVVEAMSAGLPVIVPTVGGIAEMVEDGWNGYKIDVQNLHKIAEHIDLMLNDRKLYKRLSGNAFEFSKRFNEKTMVETVIKLL